MWDRIERLGEIKIDRVQMMSLINQFGQDVQTSEQLCGTRSTWDKAMLAVGE